MNNIAILTQKKNEGENLKKCLISFNNTWDTVNTLSKEDVLNGKAQNIETIFSTWYMPLFNEEEIQRHMPNLKRIFYIAGSVKYFAIPFLNTGVRIFSASNANAVPVAEFTVSQIILANKGYFQAQRICKWPTWKFGYNRAKAISESKSGNYKSKIGILGCGSVGSKVAELLKGYSLTTYVYDPYITDEKASKLNVKKVLLENIFEECDVISNHLPDIPETKGLINYTLLSKMKDTATFINTGRGNQVDEKALNKVLKRNPQMCALLDVTSHEPLRPWSPLYWRNNIFITPHIAGSQSFEFYRMVEYILQTFENFSNGITNNCEITLEILNKTA